MQYCGTLISVSDMAKAKEFYEKVMEQEIVMDLGVHVAFKSGLSLQSNYEELVGEKLNMKPQPDNFQLYFEVEDFDRSNAKLKATADIRLLHDRKEYPWGQRVMRIYDCDGYIVEVSESMASVVKRFLADGFTPEETAEKTMFPMEFVMQFV